MTEDQEHKGDSFNGFAIWAGKTFALLFVLFVAVMAFAFLKGTGKGVQRMRQQEEADAPAKAEELARPKGPCDAIPMWLDGRPASVRDLMNSSLHDPKSFSLIGNSKIEFVDGMCVMSSRYRAKNSFGALVLEEQIFYMDQLGRVVKVEKK